MTLYYKDAGYIGRTYCSKAFQAKRAVRTSPTFEVDIQEYVVFHSSLPIETLSLVVEVLGFEKQGDVPAPYSEFSIGWATLNFVKDKVTSTRLHEGTNRCLTLGKLPGKLAVAHTFHRAAD